MSSLGLTFWICASGSRSVRKALIVAVPSNVRRSQVRARMSFQYRDTDDDAVVVSKGSGRRLEEKSDSTRRLVTPSTSPVSATLEKDESQVEATLVASTSVGTVVPSLDKVGRDASIGWGSLMISCELKRMRQAEFYPNPQAGLYHHMSIVHFIYPS